MMLTVGCDRELKQYEKAKTLYQEGLALSDSSQTIAAAETYSRALLVLEQCNHERLDVKRLKGQIEDQLGTCYWKHGMKEEALALHQDAIALFRQLPGSVLLMNALQNAGRVAASLHQVDQARNYYEEALQLAKTQHKKSQYHELLFEFARDVLMEQGDYNKVIETLTDALEGGALPDHCQLILGLAHYYLKNDNLAIEYLTLATQSDQADVKMSAYQGLYKIYELQKDYPKALYCLEQFNESKEQAHAAQRNEEMQRVKRDFDLQFQKTNLEAQQKMKSVYLYLVLVVLLVALVVTLLLLRQKTLKDKLKGEESQRQLDVAMKNNKVFLTAFVLSEKILGHATEIQVEEREWNEYLELIDLVYNNFTQKLMERYPTLTKGDLQICSLTRQGFSNQVISMMMNLQANSYARRKYRIKQEKMNGTEDHRSFEEIVNEIA